MRRLEGVGTERVAVAADETRGVLDVGGHEKIGLTRAACRAIGLHCTSDFAWRNGDYALYLARQRFPDERFYWLLEPDVEHSFPTMSALFGRFAAYPDVDLLATYLNASTDDWWWSQTGRPHPTGIKRAMFCFIRVSAAAVDLCLRERRRGRWRIRDRLFWPNDEVFVATEVAHAGLRYADLNDLGAPVYDRETFGFDNLLDGTAGTFRERHDRIFHPVLYGDAYAARLARNERAQAVRPLAQRIGRRIQVNLRGRGRRGLRTGTKAIML